MPRIFKNLMPWMIVLTGLMLVTFFMKGNDIGFLDIRSGLLSDQLLGSTEVVGDEFPKILIDPIGEEYLLKRPPKRIVSVTLGTDEILSALMRPESLTDSIVGVTHFVDDESMSSIPFKYPKNIKRIRGGVEEILSLQPDLAFVAGFTRAETVRLLLGSGIPVVRLTAYESFDDIKKNIQLVAAVTGTETHAAKLLEALDKKSHKTTVKVKQLPKPRVLYYNLSEYTVGLGTRIDETISLAGGYNVLHDTGISGNHKISEEMAIGLEPDIILLTGWTGIENNSPSAQLMSRTAWENVPAVLNKRVFNLRGAWILSVSQYSWDGIEEMAKLIHPEAFN